MGRKSKRKKHRRASLISPQEPQFIEQGNGGEKEHIISTSHSSEKSEAPKKQANSGFALFLIKIIRWGTYIALFAPLVVRADFFFPFVVPKTIFFWVFAEIIFAAWLILAISNKDFRPKWNPLSVTVLVFLMVTIITSFTGINVERSFWSTFERMAGTINWIHLVMFFFVISSTFRTVSEWKKLAGVSLIASSLVALLFLSPKIGIALIPFDTRGGSTIGNSSFMAAYLLFNIFFGIWLFSKAQDQWRKVLYGAGLGIIVFTVLLATAYGALVSMFGGFFIIFLSWLTFSKIWGAKIKLTRAVAGVLLLGAILSAGLVTWGTFTQNESIIGKLPYFFSNEGTIGARKVVWAMAWEGVKERPVLGWGSENFNAVFTKYFNPCLPLTECGGEVWFDRTHNIILDNLIHSGIIGLLSYLAIFAAVLFQLWKRVLRAGADWIFPAVITAALASYFAQNLLVFDMLNTYLMFAFTLAFALAVSSSTSEQPPSYQGLSIPRPFIGAAVGIFLLYFLISFGVQSIQAARWGISINRASVPYEERMATYKKSLSVSPLGNRQVPEFFTNRFIDWTQNDSRISADVISEVERIMKETLVKNPYDYRHRLILGNFYNAARAYDPTYLDKAEELLKAAIEMGPTNQQGYIMLSRTYLLKEEYDKSFATLKKAIDLEPRHTDARLYLAESYSIAEEYEAAREEFEKLFDSGYRTSDPYYISRIAQTYEEVAEYDKAVEWYTKFVESRKDDPKLHLKLADLYRKAGQIDEARAEALEVERLNSDSNAPNAAEISKALDELLKKLK